MPPPRRVQILGYDEVTLAGLTPLPREQMVDITNFVLVTGDGVTAGGIRNAREDLANVAAVSDLVVGKATVAMARQLFWASATAGTANAIDVGDIDLHSWAARVRIYFVPASTNTASTTFSASDGTTTQTATVKRRGPGGTVGNLIGGEFIAGQLNYVEHDGTNLFVGRASELLNGLAIASAATLNLITATSPYFHVTGTTGITAISNGLPGQLYVAQFDGIVALTYHASNLIIPGAASYTTAAGDTALLLALTATTARILAIFKADGTPVIAPTVQTPALIEDTVTSRTGAFTAVAQTIHRVDTSGGVATPTFPSGPPDKTRIRFEDFKHSFGTNNIVPTAGAGDTVMGAATYTGDVSYIALEFSYDDATNDWELV